MICDCSPAVFDDAGQVLRVGTCPVCLPAGAITWLIENGRQVEMFSGPAEVLAVDPFVPQIDRCGSVSALVEGEGSMRNEYMTQGLCSCDLPF